MNATTLLARPFLPFLLPFLILAGVSPAWGQNEIRISYQGTLPEDWYDMAQKETPFAVRNFAQENLAGLTGQDYSSQAFINWLLLGGASVKAYPSTYADFIQAYVTGQENDEYLEYYRTAFKSKNEYFQSKYKGGLPAGITRKTINGYEALTYSTRSTGEDEEKGEYTYFLEVDAATGRGAGILAGIVHRPGKRTYAYADYERGVDFIISNLRFDLNTPTTNVPVSSPSGDNGIPWIVVVGVGIGVVAIGAKVIQARAKKKKDQQPAGYVLQLSTASVKVEWEHPAAFEAAVWKVDGSGVYSAVTDAAIEILVPPGAGFLGITPASGYGKLQVTVSLTQLPTTGEVQLQVNARTGGGSKTASVSVSCAPEFKAFINGKTEADVRYETASRCWRFFDIIAGFWSGNVPVTPAFKFGFPTPPFIEGQDVLKVDEAYGTEGSKTYVFKVSAKVDLETVLGPKLDREEGKIKVTVVAIDERGVKHKATVYYRVRPELRMVVVSSNNTAAGVEFDDLEFLADGQDRLSLQVHFERTDKQPQDTEASQPDESMQVRSTEFASKADAQAYSKVANESLSGPGIFAYDVGSLYFMEATKERVGRSPRLRVDAVIPQNYDFDKDSLAIQLKPLFPRLRLWVVPGRCRGTSEAYAYLDLISCAKKAKPFSGRTLSLNIEVCTGGPGLLLDSCDADQITREEDDLGNTSGLLPKGSVRWVLRYTGLTWANLRQAVFDVGCQVPGKDGAPLLSKKDTLNIGANVDALLADLIADHEFCDRHLNNSYFETEASGTARAFFRVVPFMRGPCWNAVLGGSSGEYLCTKMRHHIVEWLDARRLYVGDRAHIAVMHSMNGIEYDYYSVYAGTAEHGMGHAWAAIFLSGNGRYDDWRAIDPWWYQKWKTSTLDDMMTKWDENAKMVETAGVIAAGIVVVAKVCVGIAAALGFEVAMDSILVMLQRFGKFWGGTTVRGAAGRLTGYTMMYDLASTADDDCCKSDDSLKKWHSDWFKRFVDDLAQHGGIS